MNNKLLKEFFPSLKETFTMEPLYDPVDNKMYWIVDEEKERWYTITGFPTCIMVRRNNQMLCHSSWEVKVGEIV